LTFVEGEALLDQVLLAKAGAAAPIRAAFEELSARFAPETSADVTGACGEIGDVPVVRYTSVDLAVGDGAGTVSVEEECVEDVQFEMVGVAPDAPPIGRGGMVPSAAAPPPPVSNAAVVEETPSPKPARRRKASKKTGKKAHQKKAEAKASSKTRVTKRKTRKTTTKAAKKATKGAKKASKATRKKAATPKKAKQTKRKR
jgi:hypothetical protein